MTETHPAKYRAFGIDWVPWNVPLKKRLDALGAGGFIFLMMFGEMITLYFFIQLLYSRFWWLALIYCTWMLYDIEICNRGGRKSEWVRNWAWWRYYRDHFPIKLIKTHDLDPAKNYLFSCFPHGVIGTSALNVFASNAGGFYKLFPGLTFNMVTIRLHYLVPLFREFSLGLGGCSSSEESLLYLLDPKRYKGKCVALLVGGASEAANTQNGRYKIILKRRKGFIRVALKSGASLVPVISFGENDIFRPILAPENTLMRKFQDKFRDITGISLMFPNGRGLFQYSFGIVPLSVPINVVVGSPIDVKKTPDPTDDEINALHAKFTERLIELFENEKSKYVKDHKNVKLIIT